MRVTTWLAPSNGDDCFSAPPMMAAFSACTRPGTVLTEQSASRRPAAHRTPCTIAGHVFASLNTSSK